MIRTLAAAGALVLALAAAAEAQVPQVPTPVNPRPDYPIATNGTPLPFRDFAGPGYGPTAYSGRSVGLDAPVLAPIGNLVNGGIGFAGTALNGVGAATGAVVGGVLGQR